MRSARSRWGLFALALVASACGRFDNTPFQTGVVRGVVTDADDTAFVMVVGHDELVTTPALDTGAFELRGVPLGAQELLIVATPRRALRVSVEVGGGDAVELGALEPKPTVHFEVYVRAPGNQRIAGTVFLEGTPVSAPIRGSESEAEFNVPAGCYTARAVVAGLGEKSMTECIPEGATSWESPLTLDAPDGSAGREGCVVSGCQGGLSCQTDLACR